jgi:hypothetical protein
LFDNPYTMVRIHNFFTKLEFHRWTAPPKGMLKF